MNIICKLFGHKWNGCRCRRCGVTREIGHRFGYKNGEYHICVVCRKKMPHSLEGCVCKICGGTVHEFDRDGFCVRCGQGREIGRYDGCRMVLRKKHCSRCEKETPHFSVLCDMPGDRNRGGEYHSYCLSCGEAPYCPKCKEFVHVKQLRDDTYGTVGIRCAQCGTRLEGKNRGIYK